MRRLFFALPFLLSCESPTEPELPANAVRMEPPAEYRLWWGMVEACSGRSADLLRVQWFAVPGRDIVVDGQAYHGYWIGRPDRIYIAEQSRLAGPLVRHEMLHAIAAEGGHSRDLYLERCGGYVACEGGCEWDAGTHLDPPFAAPELVPRDVHVQLQLLPAAPSVSAVNGATAFVVSVANPIAQPVWIRLTPQEPGHPYPATFGIILDYGDPAYPFGNGHHYTDRMRFGLEAGGVRRAVFDRTLNPGRYGARAYFDADTTARVEFEVLP